LKLFVGKTERS